MIDEDGPQVNREIEENKQESTENIPPPIVQENEVELTDAFDLTDTPEELLLQIQNQAVKMKKPIF